MKKYKETIMILGNSTSVNFRNFVLGLATYYEQIYVCDLLRNPPKQFDEESIQVLQFPSLPKGKLRYLVLSSTSLKQQLKELTPSLILCYGASSLPIATRLAGAKNVVSFATGSDIMYSAQKGSILAPQIWKSLKNNLKLYSYSAEIEKIVNNNLPNLLTERYWEGIDCHCLPIKKEGKRSHKIVCIRGFDFPYGQEGLAEIMVPVLKKHPHLILDYYGTGISSIIKNVKKIYKDNDIDSQVNFLGKVPREALLNKLPEYDYYLSGSLWDGTSFSLLEAMHIGLLPIINDIPANLECLQKDYPYYFKNDDEESILNVFNRTEKDDWNDILEKNRQFVHKNADRKTNFKHLAQDLHRLIPCKSKGDLQQPNSEIKKIFCLVGQLGNGGTEKQLFLFLKNIDRSKYLPTVVVNNSPEGVWKPEIEALGIKILTLKTSLTPLYKFVKFKYLLIKRNPDIIFSWSIFTNIFHIASGNIPFIGSLRQQLSIEKEKLNSIFLKKCLSGIPIVVNSNYVQEELIAEGIPKKDISVIHNIYEPFKGKREPVSTLRNKYKIPLDSILVLGVGRDSPSKDFGFFIDVIEKASEKFPKIHGCLIGSGGTAWKNEIEKRGLNSQITVTGEIQDCRNILHIGDIFFLSSKAEGLPNVVLEAIDAKCALLTTKVGGISDILSTLDTNLKNKILLDKKDIELSANKLIKLAKDKKLREKISSSLNKTMSEFNNQKISEKYESLIDSISEYGLNS